MGDKRQSQTNYADVKMTYNAEYAAYKHCEADGEERVIKGLVVADGVFRDGPFLGVPRAALFVRVH